MNSDARDKFLKTQMTIAKLGREASTLDMASFLKYINQAEVCGPVVDPTLFIKAAGNLRALKKVAMAVIVLQEAHHELFRSVLETTVKGHTLPPSPSEAV